MRRPDILVINPPRATRASLAIAACRADAIGVLDFEYTDAVADCVATLSELERFTTTDFGVKLGRDSHSLVERLLGDPHDRLRHVLLAGGEHDRLGDWVGAFKARGVRVLVECVSLDEVRAARRHAADGVVLKGQESGGRVGDETTFILLQRCAQELREHSPASPLEVFAQGAIGFHSAAASMAAGARGVVLDSQLSQLRESPLNESDRSWLAALDGSETILVGEGLGEAYRVAHRPRCASLLRLTAEAERIASEFSEPQERLRHWRAAVREVVERHAAGVPIMLGQDAALGKRLADRCMTVGGVVTELRRQVSAHLSAARATKPVAENSSLAVSHRTRYPILQGPMTRVSDTAAFADAVSQAGALPFLALAMLRKAEVETLLRETRERLGERSWGVGILGFLPAEIRKEQLSAVHEVKPPFAIIAGGRPDQAQELERVGIRAYLHVPSPGLLKMFLKDGARRFVFEGRECGGHVGPRGSFLLWETMCDVLLDHLGAAQGEDLHVVFAGGIHDALSAGMVAALAAPLAEKGAKIGLLMGTAYLFTREAVEAGAIVPRFQREAIDCDKTVLLETAPGHAIRCVPTPYCDAFDEEKERLRSAGKSHEEIVKTLEWMNIGRLRVASKGLDRVKGEGLAKLAPVGDDDQFARGMYMIGQIAAMRREIVSIAELHEEVCGGGTRSLETRLADVTQPTNHEKPCDIAIIGMACFYPGATSVDRFWHNILRKRYAVTEVPASHWDWRLYYSTDPKPQDKFVSKWGGFLDEIHIDPFHYGITPKTMQVIEPNQLYLLEAVRLAIDDAGYTHRAFNRDKTAAILGIGGGGSPLAVSYGFRTCLPLLDQLPNMPLKSEELLGIAGPLLPQWTEDSFPGFLMNVAAGRVANRFNLGGPNYAMDAACASSLAALYNCIRELESGTSDMAIAMGADTVQTPYSYMAFSKTHALSKQGRCRPFDADADGIVLSEGVSAVILKRLADAERDGDRVYAVIRGMGCSSDGKDKGLTAPNSKGQVLALRRAYSKAGVSPARLGLIEAHGTGTVAGDKTEAEALSAIMLESGAAASTCALGSVKSMIGHSKCAAGLAGLIKATMSLHTKTLPPTLVEKPNRLVGFDQNPLYLNTDARPWIHQETTPRLAGVSAFGFGGTNYHAVLEEYTGDHLRESTPALSDWPVELCVWRAASTEELMAAARACASALSAGAKPRFRDLAASLWNESRKLAAESPTLAIVATSLDDLKDKIRLASESVSTEKSHWHDPRGVHFSAASNSDARKVAFLFPGQGSQYPNMLADVAMSFAEVRRTLDRAEGALADRLVKPLGHFLYPPSVFDESGERANALALARTDVAQAALGATSLGMFRLLTNLGLKPDMVAGHSYGEYTALAAAGAIEETDFFHLSHLRGSLIRDRATGGAPGALGGMAAVEADADVTSDMTRAVAGVTLANMNSPRQTVIAGSDDAIARAIACCEKRGVRAKRIAVTCAFHSPLVAHANTPLAAALRDTRFSAPQVDVYSNTTAGLYPTSTDSIAALLAEHLVSPVRFREQIEAMHAAGARCFIEVGPQGVLTNLVKQTLAEKPHVAVAADIKGRDGLTQLCHLLAQLMAHGVAVDLDRLFEDRHVRTFAMAKLAEQDSTPRIARGAWQVNSVRAKPVGAPEPLLLGQSIPKERLHEFVDTKAAPHTPAARVAPTETSAPPSPRTAAMANGKNDEPSRIPPATRVADHKHQEPRFAMQPSNGQMNSHADDEVTRVMLGHQALMAKFLETQRAVMMAYFGADAGTPNAITLPTHDALAMPARADGHAAVHANGAATNGAAPNGAPANGVPPREDQPSRAPSRSHAPLSNGVAHVPVNRILGRTLEEADEIDAGSNGQPSDAKATSQAFDRATVSDRLIELVSQRTGYPRDMLDVDLDMEADLGIDSIKRVEILRDLAEFLNVTQDSDGPKLEFERLTSIRTIRGILNYLEEALTEAEPNPAPAKDSKPAFEESSLAGDVGVAPIQRGLLELVAAPLRERSEALIPSGAVLLTDDGRGVASEIAERLACIGQEVVLIRFSRDDAAEERDGVFHADLTEPRSVEALAQRVRKRVGSVGGFIHLSPLATATADDERSLERMARDVKSLYLLAREFEDDLRQAGRDGGSMLLAASALGGGMGLCDAPQADPFLAGQGAIAGFLKCVGQEWPEVLVRAIDVDGALAASELAEVILSELTDRDGPREVGRAGGLRVTWRAVAGAFGDDREPLAPIDSNTTLLITGGARGITSAIAHELARRFQPNMILVGRSREPADAEGEDTAELRSQAEIKAVLIDRARARGAQPEPAAIQAEYARLMCDREIRDALSRIRAAGSKCVYRSADVRDEAAMKAILDEATERFGGVDGVIHAAGVIEDKLLADKTNESFDRVFDTKVQGAMVLARLLDLERLRFMALFASVASRYGNRGQSDYAAANEVLAKLAWNLDRRSGCRVFAVDWGPWSEIGMVSDLAKHLVARGIQMIAPEVGAAMFIDELLLGRKGESEVIIGGGAERLVAAPGAAEQAVSVSSSTS